jgi:hypothetical protein
MLSGLLLISTILAADGCGDSLRKIHQSASVALTDADKAALRTARDKVLAEVKSKEKSRTGRYRAYHFLPGLRVVVDDKEVEIVQTLGWGADGVVYLVKSNDQQLFSLKYFYNRKQLRKHPNLLKKSAEKLDSIDFLKIDYQKKLALMTYIFGIDVDVIYIKNDLGLSNELKNKLWPFVKNACLETSTGNANILLEIETGKFILIDPY